MCREAPCDREQSRMSRVLETLECRLLFPLIGCAVQLFSSTYTGSSDSLCRSSRRAFPATWSVIRIVPFDPNCALDGEFRP